MRKFLILIFIVLATLAGLGAWIWQKNVYSKDILKLEILGPNEVTVGQEAEYFVKYKNNGNFRLDTPQLVFDSPAYSMGADGKAMGRQILDQEKLGGAVYPGQEQTFSFKARILGKEGERRVAKAVLSYQPKNLKARYESSTSFTTTIKSVPVSFDFDIPTKANFGESFIFRMNYFSNIEYSLFGLRIQIDYPSGFEFVHSSPKSLEKTEWEIPVLNKNQGGRIEVSGKISGEIGEAKLFKARLGIWLDGEFVVLKEAERGVEMTKPSIYLRQEINGNPEYVATPGDWLHYEIFFKNVGDDDVNNLFMIVNLEGEAFEFFTIKSDLGNYQSGDNSIVFDWRRLQKLQYLPPLDEGKVDFWVRLKEDLGSVRNPVLKSKIFISQLKQEFLTKISSKIEVTQRGYFQDEVFGNSGPLPPLVGEQTTYTILWQAKNYYSDVRNVKVKTVLPPEVSLTSKIFPESEISKISFDSQSRELVWNVGDMKKGKGVLDSGPNISFQIVFVPTVDQRGQTPEIIGQTEISGEDSWTEAAIRGNISAVTTALPDDKTINDNQKVVQ